MKRFYFVVLDSAAATYATPFLAVSVGAATRTFGDEVRRKDSLLNAHPEHFSLYRVGTWDDDTGVISPEPVPVFLLKAVDVLAESPQ